MANKRTRTRRVSTSNLVLMWCVGIAAMGTMVIGQVAPAEESTVVLGKIVALGNMLGQEEAGDPVEIVAGDEDARAQSDAEALNGHAIQSIAFKRDMSIRDALRFLSLKYQKNIVPTAGVTGDITLTNLYDVTFEEALQAIIGLHKYDVQGNFIMIYTPEEYSQAQMDINRIEHEIITLYYINSTEAVRLVTPLLSEFGQIASTTAVEPGAEAGQGGDSISIRDRVVVSDFPENLEAIMETIDSIDIMPPQILLEVTILEAELNEATKFGVDLDALGVSPVSSSTDSIGDKGISLGGFATGVGGTTGLSIGLAMDHIRLFIRALETITDTTVLANPKILALNKQVGKLIIGNEDGYLTTSQVSDGGVVTQEVEFLESGIVLEFRPFICDNGYIRMEIHPEQSEGSIAGGLPEKSTKEVHTNVMVKDGKTIVIGGMFKEKTIVSRSQVPLLGDIPIIGEVFKKTDDLSVRTELIVLITPHIINDPEDTKGAARLADARRIAQGARKNLSWLSRARLAEDRYARAVEHYSKGEMGAAMSELTGFSSFENLRSTLEVERLKERIIRKSQPGGLKRIERIMRQIIEKEDSRLWMRR